MRILFLKIEYLKALKALEGQFAAPAHVDQTIDETTEVRTPKGDVTAIYFRDVIPRELHECAYKSWRIVSERPTNRSTAVGSRSLPRLKKDGTLGNRRVVSKHVVSVLERRDTAHGTLGYFDATPDKPCHETPLTKRHPEMLNRNKLLIKVVDRAYEYFLSRFYAKQRAEVDKVPHFRLWHTAFSTIYLAKNFRTAYHYDTGNLKGVRTALLPMGDFTGGELVLPRWQIAFALRPGDLLFFDPQQLHGNLPFKGERLSAAFYCERRIAKCRKR
jgi:hypothetical protein